MFSFEKGDEGDEDKDAAGKEVKRERAFTATGEPVEVIDDAPKPSCFARMRTRLTGFHAKLVAFVILPNSKLRFIEYVNTALIVLTSNLIMFMVSDKNIIVIITINSVIIIIIIIIIIIFLIVKIHLFIFIFNYFYI